MRRSILFGLFLLLLGGLSLAENAEEATFGPNTLRSSPDVTRYHEDARGIPRYVEGHLSDRKAPGDEIATALTFFETHRGAYKMTSPSEELRVRRVEHDRLGMTHVRLDQQYRGIPVVGGNLIAHFTRLGQLKTVNGYYYHDIDLDITASVAAADAVRLASEHLASFFGVGHPDEPKLVVFPWEDTFYLCWRLFLYSDTPMGRWEYFIDARTGGVVFHANRIMNENDIGTGYGVMGDFRDHIDTDYSGSVYQMRDYTRQLNNDPHGHGGQMPDGSFIQTNIAGSSLPGSIATDDDNLWDNVDTQRPAVDGHVYTALFYDWLLAEMGRNGFNDNGATMLTSVNYYAEGDNNAYWNGNQIVVWSWSTGWRSLAGCPDVIAHEWGHAITDYSSDLVYQKEPGALNESFSDMIGAAFEWAHPAYDTPDWDMGENGRLTGIGFRSMEDPHAFGDPDYYGPTDPYWIDVIDCTPSYTNDYCGVHTNSGVGNKWFVLLSDGGTHYGVTVTGIGVANAIQVAYRANAYYWNANTDYHQGALGTISAANDLDPTEAWAIQAATAWNAVGVSTPGPSLVFDYPDGVPTMLIPDQDFSFEVNITGSLGGEPVPASGQIHFSLDGGAFVTDAMTPITSTRYSATLPAAACESRYGFYISAEETSTGTHYDPSPSSPNVAVVADSAIIVFQDNFETDKGWTVSGDAVDGQWNRGVPAGGGERGDPPDDYDGSGMCFLTDNVYGNSDVDDGTTNLDSPEFDLSGGDARIEYARWYSNNYGNAPYSDVMRIYISSDGGAGWTVADTAGPTDQAAGGWYVHSFRAGEFVTPTAHMKLRFEASDLGDGSVVEAAVDAVSVTMYVCESPGEPLEITTESLPDWTAGSPYSQQLEATGGVGMHMWLDKYDDLDGTGLSLSIEGVLSGMPLAAGIIAFTAEVSDQGSQSTQKPFTVTINDEVTITTLTLPDWTIGIPYSRQLEAAGGTGSHTWTDQNADLTGTGLSLSLAGLLAGTPSVTGPLIFTARVTDDVGASDENEFTVTINAAVSVSTDSLPNGELDAPYSQQLEAAGGTGQKIWTDRDASLAGTGLSLSADGLLSGTPIAEGTIAFVARVTDAVGSAGEAPLAFQIIRPYICGDANNDSDVNVADVVFIINYVFKQGSQPAYMDAADANCDDTVNLGDGVYIINYVFKDGPAACCP